MDSTDGIKCDPVEGTKYDNIKCDDISLTIKQPELSDWRCYLWGNTPGGSGIIYTPVKDSVPNIFVRWMMKICFACTWVKGE